MLPSLLPSLWEGRSLLRGGSGFRKRFLRGFEIVLVLSETVLVLVLESFDRTKRCLVAAPSRWLPASETSPGRPAPLRYHFPFPF